MDTMDASNMVPRNMGAASTKEDKTVLMAIFGTVVAVMVALVGVFIWQVRKTPESWKTNELSKATQNVKIQCHSLTRI